MVDTASGAAPNTAVAKLGFGRDQVILELGYDDDADDVLRDQIEDAVNGELKMRTTSMSSTASCCGGAKGDGDLTDALIGAVTAFEDQGFDRPTQPQSGSPRRGRSDRHRRSGRDSWPPGQRQRQPHDGVVGHTTCRSEVGTSVAGALGASLPGRAHWSHGRHPTRRGRHGTGLHAPRPVRHADLAA